MIAISYRREDTLPIAGRLYDRLQAEFGKENVFMDFDSIPYGVDFREHIKQMIDRSKVVIAMIGANWFGKGTQQARRIDDPTDFVRFEIAYALERKIPVIPVLINHTPMPKANDLPPEIAGLAFRNAVTLDAGIDFHPHASRLIVGIDRLIEERKCPYRPGAIKPKAEPPVEKPRPVALPPPVVQSSQVSQVDAPRKREVESASAQAPAPKQDRAPSPPVRPVICVLPFANISGEAEQEYFSDGISEDIITDLSKISALRVVSRNTTFTFKGKAVDVGQVVRQLKVRYVLEGSVRKAAGRVRVSAQLIDGTNDSHVWAERYDRDLNDIFAIQDEISHAIVGALKVKLLPEEKRAIEYRGTANVDAYNLFLMARRTYATGFEGDSHRLEAIIRICRRAIEIDPNYAEAWALIALAEVLLRSYVGREGGDGGLGAADRALELNPNLAEVHAVKARILSDENRNGDASGEIEIALRLDPESYQVNRFAGLLKFRQKQLKESVAYWEKCMSLEESDFASGGMLITAYTTLGNHEDATRIAKITLERCNKILAGDPDNGAAMGHGSLAWALLDQRESAMDWMARALLVDPDNLTMRYNFVCTLANYLDEKDAALEMLRPAFERMTIGLINHARVDPDLDRIRDDPRFKDMLAAAERRLAASDS